MKRMTLRLIFVALLLFCGLINVRASKVASSGGGSSSWWIGGLSGHVEQEKEIIVESEADLYVAPFADPYTLKERQCYYIGFQNCPTGVTEWCVDGLANPTNPVHAKLACEACYGVKCKAYIKDCAGKGYGPAKPGFQCEKVFFGYEAGCSGPAGRTWRSCDSMVSADLSPWSDTLLRHQVTGGQSGSGNN